MKTEFSKLLTMKKPKLSLNVPKAIVLFAGGGGIEVGMVQAGIRPYISVECDPSNPKLSSKIADINELNFKFYGSRMIRKPVECIDYSKFRKNIDFLHASPVCANFSNATRGVNQESKQDLKTSKAVCKALQNIQPLNFTLEQVPDYRKSESYSSIIQTLEKLGYNYEEMVLNFADYGLPQSRVRLIIRASLNVLKPFPKPLEKRIGWYKVCQPLINDLPDDELSKDQKVYLTINKLTNIRKAFIYRQLRFDELRVYQENDIIGTITKSHGSRKYANIIDEFGNVKAINEKILAKLQGFPDCYDFKECYAVAGTIIGYSVPPSFAKIIFESFK